MYGRPTENNCCSFRNNYLSHESYSEHRVSKGKMDSELADKPEINRIKNIINLNIMKCIKYIHILKWFYVCVSWGGGVPECCGVHVEVSRNWRSGLSPSTLGIPGLRLNSSHLEASGKCYNYWEPEICINVANVPH